MRQRAQVLTWRGSVPQQPRQPAARFSPKPSPSRWTDFVQPLAHPIDLKRDSSPTALPKELPEPSTEDAPRKMAQGESTTDPRRRRQLKPQRWGMPSSTGSYRSWTIRGPTPCRPTPTLPAGSGPRQSGCCSKSPGSIYGVSGDNRGRISASGAGDRRARSPRWRNAIAQTVTA